jgi:tetratricopeptide (TPR) repeat protein
MSRSPRAHRWRTAVLSAALLTSGAASQVPNSTRVPQKQQVEDLETWNEIAPYLHIIASYRAGRVDDAVRDILAWSSISLDDARHRIRDLRSRVVLCRTATPAIDARTSAGEIEVADLDAAVLLHTDAAMRALERNLSSWTEIQLRAAKALYDWTHGLTADWSRAPVDLPRGCHPVPELGRRDWHLAVAWSLLGHWEPTLATSFAAIGLEAAPADAEMLLAAGTIREALALEGVQHPVRRPVWARPNNFVFGRPLAVSIDVKENLNGARELYERGLAARPVYVQTHLRLGRVLSLLDRLDAARAELELVAANADAARERYLAELFLARVAEQADDDETAVVHYRRAIDAWPDSQAARVGLVQALGRKDGSDGAPKELREFLSQPWPRAVTSDPWWVYPFGESERGPQLLDELRRRFVNGESNGRRN